MKSVFIIDTSGEVRLSSINPRVWGPMYWNAMFMRAGRYPITNPTQEDRANIKAFYYNLITELPCSLCRKSYKELLNRFPIDTYLNSRKDVLTWLWLIRDQVNRKLIVQERAERDAYLEKIPDHVPNRIKEANDIFIHTKPSPPVESVVRKWFQPQ